mgnify:CR=1 FL=1
MAAGNTKDTRTHVMGDMLMLTGTFTDGGTQVSYGNQLSTIFAAGGHATSFYATGIETNGAKAIGDTTFTVKTVDQRLHFNVGETVYSSASGDGSDLLIVGVITAMAADATGMTIGGGVLNTIDANGQLYKSGGNQSAVTLTSGQLEVSIDETNELVLFGNGNLGAASTASVQDGRWWILGTR